MPNYSFGYQSHAVYVGPCPSTGYHFMDYHGNLNDEHWNDLNHNLVMDLARVKSFSYDVSVEKNDLLQIGKKATIGRPIITSPTININMTYGLMGLKNEARLGFFVNYSQFQNNLSGQPRYEDNFQVNLFSGFESRDLTQPSEDPYWPPNCRDIRNIFLVDLENHQEIFKEPFTRDLTLNKNNFAHHLANQLNVLSFGNCYLTSYSTSARINGSPEANVNFIAENYQFTTSGSGASIPGVHPENRIQESGLHFVIPGAHPNEGSSILYPGDITIDISSVEEDDIIDIPFNFENLQIQGYEIRFDLNRQSLSRLGYKLPEDRQITYPLFIDLTFDIIVNEHETGSLVDLVDKNGTYNATIKLKDPGCQPPEQPEFGLGGLSPNAGEATIRYDFHGMKLETVSDSVAIGAKRTASFAFRTEIDPDTPDIGFYISGLLNIQDIEDYLIDESGSYILNDESGLIIVNNKPLF